MACFAILTKTPAFPAKERRALLFCSQIPELFGRGGRLDFSLGSDAEASEVVFLLGCKPGKAVFPQDGHHFFTDFPPGSMDRTEYILLADTFTCQALIQVKGTFFRFYDVEQGNLIRVLCQEKTTADATLGANDAGLYQRLQNFGKESGRNVLGFAYVLFIDDFTSGLFGQV
jgi:hypothetical protein